MISFTDSPACDILLQIRRMWGFPKNIGLRVHSETMRALIETNFVDMIPWTVHFSDATSPSFDARSGPPLGNYALVRGKGCVLGFPLQVSDSFPEGLGADRVGPIERRA